MAQSDATGRTAAAQLGDLRGAHELAQRIAEFLLERHQMSMLVRADMVNGHGICHGGVYLHSPTPRLRSRAIPTMLLTVTALDFLLPATVMDGSRARSLAGAPQRHI
jgi:hypothetical protein